MADVEKIEFDTTKNSFYEFFEHKIPCINKRQS
jgi:hypothetical protein